MNIDSFHNPTAGRVLFLAWTPGCGSLSDSCEASRYLLAFDGADDLHGVLIENLPQEWRLRMTAMGGDTGL
jgi:hypothetical protein